MQGVTIGISLAACIALIILILAKPGLQIKGHKISIFWVPAFLGAVALVASRAIDLPSVWSGLTANTAVNPLKILVLFISMTVISVYLDEVGFFRFLAAATLKRAGKKQLVLFTVLYFVVAILTVVTSNDIIVLTFSPFICHFAKSAKINPVPYLVAEFVSANTWSMMLVIGNPTNIYLATGAGVAFADYFLVMALPTVCAGAMAFGMLLLIFGKQLNAPIEGEPEDFKIADKAGLTIGLIHLIACTIMLVIASYINLEMWYIALAFAASLFATVSISKLIKAKGKRPEFKDVVTTLKRAPWDLIPFVLSMFVIVLSLKANGIVSALGSILSGAQTVFSFGFASLLFSNLINNIPMSVLFGAITETLSQEAYLSGVYASIIGSNIGAYLTPVGALAGIMWTGILRTHKVKFSFFDFIKYGIAVALPTIGVALLVLWGIL